MAAYEGSPSVSFTYKRSSRSATTGAPDWEKPILSDRLKLIVMGEGFKLQSEKTAIRHRTERQLVTGLIVNQFVNVPRSHWSTSFKVACST